VKLYHKITLATFAVTITALVFVGVGEYFVQRRALEERFGVRLKAIAATGAPWIDPGSSEERQRAVLEKVRAANGLEDYDLFTLRRKSNGSFEFTAALREWSGDRGYEPPPEIRSIVLQALDSGEARYTPIYTDKFATFVSAFAPLRGKDGRVAGLIEVDQDVGVFVAELRRRLLRQVWIFPVALLLAAALAFPLSRSLTRAVTRLLEGVEAVHAGHYDRPVEVTTRDELRLLADAFNEMLHGLRERFAMLRFVPRHTRAVITEAARAEGAGSGAFAARLHEVAVLFSDIRGFTEFSDALPPTRVIEMLNICLRHQAEIVERHGGSIDKFIGDAVMAVFEGEDRFARAVAAAREIQSVFAGLNARGAFEKPIALGIGVAGGPVVMGSVGYEERMEFAVVGRLVNLASRLCGQAGRGEIVVSDAAFAAAACGGPSERLDGVKLKGFAEPITCFKLR
jgi:class 3 adenylate cyclase